ncbi:Uncharacterised protein [uncultured archaeon]|nr:Uncharacterised protein [uncultured archaeon]
MCRIAPALNPLKAFNQSMCYFTIWQSRASVFLAGEESPIRD